MVLNFIWIGFFLIGFAACVPAANWLSGKVRTAVLLRTFSFHSSLRPKVSKSST